MPRLVQIEAWFFGIINCILPNLAIIGYLKCVHFFYYGSPKKLNFFWAHLWYYLIKRNMLLAHAKLVSGILRKLCTTQIIRFFLLCFVIQINVQYINLFYCVHQELNAYYSHLVKMFIEFFLNPLLLFSPLWSICRKFYEILAISTFSTGI